MMKITPNIMRIVIILVYRFENPAAEGIVFFEVAPEATFGEVVAEHIFVEVAHRAHVENHCLRVDERTCVEVEVVGRSEVHDVGVDYGLLACG